MLKRLSMLDDANENIRKKNENAKAKASISENDLIAEILEIKILYK